MGGKQLAKPTAKALTTKGTKETQRNSKKQKTTRGKRTFKLTSIYLQAEKSEGRKWDGWSTEKS
jgi:hypothetical protein